MGHFLLGKAHDFLDRREVPIYGKGSWYGEGGSYQSCYLSNQQLLPQQMLLKDVRYECHSI